MTSAIQPLVALPADMVYDGGYDWHAAAQQYLVAATDVAKVTPIIIPSLHGRIALDAILEHIDGVIITGAKSNVHPSHYGMDENEDAAPFDHARDASSLALIIAAIERGIPLIAICRGFQELNVALGGTLVHGLQNIPGRNDHRAPQGLTMPERYTIRQRVDVAANGCLAAIVGSGELMVNTVHEQGIDKLAPRLVVEAKAPDGTIESVSVKNAPSFAMGFQWHPEYWAQTDTPSRQIFEAFGKAVYEHQNKRHKR